MIKSFLISLICLAFTLSIAKAFVQDPHPFNSASDAVRFRDLTQEIRCVVCQNQNIADSSAPLASDLREKVYQMIVSSKSDTEIKNYLVKRYGDYILLRPRFNQVTVFLWLFPLISFGGVGLCLLRYFKRPSLNP